VKLSPMFPNTDNCIFFPFNSVNLDRAWSILLIIFSIQTLISLILFFSFLFYGFQFYHFLISCVGFIYLFFFFL
jgi:hypothetical protein